MKVLVADRLAEASLNEMRTLGVNVEYRPDLEAEALPAALADVNVLIVRGTPVDAKAMKAGKSLNLIIRAGAGTGTIDVKTASERGVYVANCPGKNALAVAELTMTLIGCLDRRVPDAVKSLRSGKWEKEEFAQAQGLQGRTLGVAGFGHVGKVVARMGRAYDMRVAAWSRTLTPQRAAEHDVVCVGSLLDLARRSDVFSVHLELTERTQGMISRKIIEALPDGAFFINTARSELVDWEALEELAPKKKLRIGLDVLPKEPGTRIGVYANS